MNKNFLLKNGDTFISKHSRKINNVDVKKGDKVEIVLVYKKTVDIRLNDKLITDVTFEDINEIKYLLYKDYE